MKEILKANLNNARNAEHFQFHSDVLNVFTQSVAETHQIKSLRDTYLSLFQQEDTAFVQNQAYEATKEIEAKDRVRDELFIYVKQTIDSNLYCPVANKKQAAEKLAFGLKAYRSANTKAFAENTAQITNFVGDMQSADYATHITTLGLTDAISQLKTANEAFNAVYTGRSGEKLTRASSDNMKTIRPKVDDAYRAVISALNALYQVNELVTRSAATSESLGKVIDGVNALVIQLQQTLSLRGAGSKPSVPGGPVDPSTPESTPDPEPGPGSGGGELG
ncbi:DUF6261 family protein [Bacteroides sp. OttesenSCG-928-N06]|nr:DUF6261 family protein [Bacteroides sp. OttesenSCG-928-N06]